MDVYEVHDFYASDMWCRGQFGHYAKVCAEVKNDIMYVHHGGHEDTAGVKIKLPTKTLSNGHDGVYYTTVLARFCRRIW